MALRRERGLCYNCEEKWSPSHRCKGRVMFFIANSDDPPSSETPVPEPPSLLEPTSLTTSDDPHPTNTHVSPLHFTFRFRLSLFYASFFSSFVPLFIHNQTPKPGFEFDYLVFCICNNCVYWIILMYFPFSEVIISHCD